MEKQEIIELVNSLGLTYKAEFVSQSQSRNKEEKNKSLNWTITLSKGRAELKTDYMQGIGHLKGYNQQESRKVWYDDCVKYACESGKWKPSLGFTPTSDNRPDILWKPIPAPELIDILYSLVSDADVLNYSNFEDWANSFGYDTDSRKAEKTYKDCLEIALKMRNILGEDNMRKLQEAFQDY